MIKKQSWMEQKNFFEKLPKKYKVAYHISTIVGCQLNGSQILKSDGIHRNAITIKELDCWNSDRIR